MRGMEKIKSKILEDSKRTVSHILEQAQQQAEKIKNDALKESESIRVEILDKAEAEGKEAYRRMVSTAVLEGRKELLKAKQDIIETAFISAMEKLLRLSDRDYQKLIEDMIVDAAKNEKGEILLAEQSKKRLNEDFLKKINTRIASLGDGAKLVLSDESVKAAGGFILRYGEMEINSTFEIMFEMLKPELENDVVDMLFS
ncbi:MAG: V-type ATP synthase subunit E [Clostridiaceae bacterium]|jgi:V/A-type H+-transporting ATPase subunit E|nr:V-type ATP synthase subunit E [Clostridiaceae bacterium]